MATDPVVTIGDAPPLVIRPGGTGEASLAVTVASGFHIQANPASGPFLIPAHLELSGGDGVRVKRPIYPPGEPYRLQGTENDLMTYGSTASVRVPIAVARGASPGTRVLRGILRYQACDDHSCLFPASTPIVLTVHVSSARVGSPLNPDYKEA